VMLYNILEFMANNFLIVDANIYLFLKPFQFNYIFNKSPFLFF
jgi:hypothetical protein